MAKSMAASFMALFAGMQEAYGTYAIGYNKKGAKQVGKAQTIREQLKLEHWQAHLSGEQGLGVIPIRSDNRVKWGCIDIDDYHLDIAELAKRIHQQKLPLIVCRTKSGGAHVFMFFQEPVAAADCQSTLQEIASSLGFGGSEIFPKQTEVLLERGDLGNWLNMPYFNVTATNRYAVTPDGTPATAQEFLAAADRIKLTAPELAGFSTQKADDLLPQGPPCLQALCSTGFPEGQRNNGLFALGTYCKKAHPERWKERLAELNQVVMADPLGPEEVAGLVKQHERKDYNYKCSEQPLAAYCNAAACRTRKYGVGAANSFPTMTGLTKLDSEPPLWFLDVESNRLELETDQLQDPHKFAKVCLETINVIPPPVTRAQWQQMLTPLLQDVIIIEQPRDTKRSQILVDLIEDFCTNRAKAATKSDVLRGVPWVGKLKKADKEEMTWFRLKDFMQYIRRQGFEVPTQRFVAARLRDIGAVYQFTKIGSGRNQVGVNLWGVRFYSTGAVMDTPNIEEDPM